MPTIGRRPTLGEALEYYTRQDFLDYLFAALAARRVVAVIPKTRHWEPDWGSNEVRASTVEELRAFIEGKIAGAFPGAGLDERPPYYPSFHQSVWRWQPGAGSEGKPVQVHDCVFEADLPTWREAFRDVSAILAALDRYQVCYQHKFSGHRSLHVILPGEIIPAGMRGRAAMKLARLLLNWGQAQAHGLPDITRLPYSLNEDTGFVCLPIRRGELSRFRPWQANLHLVEVNAELVQETFDARDAENMAAFLESLQSHPAIPAPRTFLLPDPAHLKPASMDRLDRLQGDEPAGEAWRRLAGSQPLAEAWLVDRLSHPDMEARWLAAEAYLIHGTGLTRTAIHALLEQREEYARAAAVDVLLRFEDDILPYLVEMLGDLQRHSAASAKTAALLAQSDSLREKVLAAIERDRGGSQEALLVAACLAGAMTGDWRSAMRMVESVEAQADLSPHLTKRLAALRLMGNLGGWDRRQSAQIAQQIASLGTEPVELLLFAAGSPYRRFRRDIVSVLAWLADPRAVELLVNALADDYTEVRRLAMRGLARIGEPAVAALIAAAGSDQGRLRRYAIHCLGVIAGMQDDPELAARIRPVILEALEDGEEEVRRQAVRAMQQFAIPGDLDRLEQFVRQATWENAMEASEKIAALGRPGSLALERMALEERSPVAAYAIANQGDARGRQVLVELLAGPDPVLQETAAELLRELKDERCVPYLANQLRSLIHWRAMFLAQELGEIGTPAAVDALIETLSSEFRLARRGAARGLGKARDPRAIQPLIACIRDEDRKVRQAAGEALFAIGKPAIAPLRSALAEAGGAEAGERNKTFRNQLNHILEKLDAQAS